MANHPIVHIEISAKDTQAAGKFYSEIFDWKLELDTNFNYLQWQPDTGPGGAFMTVNEAQGYQAGDVIVYIGTDDIDRDLAKVEQLGGKVLATKTEIQGVGWFGLFDDPTGNHIGLFTALQSMS